MRPYQPLISITQTDMVYLMAVKKKPNQYRILIHTTQIDVMDLMAVEKKTASIPNSHKEREKEIIVLYDGLYGNGWIIKKKRDD